MYGKDDLGYIMLNRATEIGKTLGYIGDGESLVETDGLSQDKEEASKRVAWGLYQVDTYAVARLTLYVVPAEPLQGCTCKLSKTKPRPSRTPEEAIQSASRGRQRPLDTLSDTSRAATSVLQPIL